MSRTLWWFIFLVGCDLVVSLYLITQMPDQTHAAMTCLAGALTK